MFSSVRIRFALVSLLMVVGNLYAQQHQPVQMASLRPNVELRWQQVSPNVHQPDGPVLYQLLFSAAGTPGTLARFDTNPRHLRNSLITDNGSMVAIGGLSISSAGTLTTTGSVTAAGLTTSGTVSAGSLTASGTVTAAGLTASGTASAGSITTTGTVTAAGLTMGGGATITNTDSIVQAVCNTTACTFSTGAGTIPANSCQDFGPLSIPGTTTSMIALVSPVGPLQTGWSSLEWMAYIPATNSYMFHICNPTTAGVTVALQTFNARVIK